MQAGDARKMRRAESQVRINNSPAGRRRRTVLDALVVDTDLGCDLPVTDAELTAIERLLGDDLARILRGSDRN